MRNSICAWPTCRRERQGCAAPDTYPPNFILIVRLTVEMSSPCSIASARSSARFGELGRLGEQFGPSQLDGHNGKFHVRSHKAACPRDRDKHLHSLVNRSLNAAIRPTNRCQHAVIVKSWRFCGDRDRLPFSVYPCRKPPRRQRCPTDIQTFKPRRFRNKGMAASRFVSRRDSGFAKAAEALQKLQIAISQIGVRQIKTLNAAKAGRERKTRRDFRIVQHEMLRRLRKCVATYCRSSSDAPL